MLKEYEISAFEVEKMKKHMHGNQILSLFMGMGVLIVGCLEETLNAQDAIQSPTASPAIAMSGDVELHSISIERARLTDATRQSDPTRMVIELWFSRPDPYGGKSVEEMNAELLHGQWMALESLEPIKDEFGTLLTTRPRLDQIVSLEKEVRVNNLDRRHSGRIGNVLKLTLDAPDRRATRIPVVKGRASFRRARGVILKFDDPERINGKVIEHPLLEKHPVLATFTPDPVKGQVRVAVQRPVVKDDRDKKLISWDFNGKRKRVKSLIGASEFKRTESAEINTSVYDISSLEGTYFEITVAELIEPRIVDFEFRDIALP